MMYAAERTGWGKRMIDHAFEYVANEIEKIINPHGFDRHPITLDHVLIFLEHLRADLTVPNKNLIEVGSIARRLSSSNFDMRHLVSLLQRLTKHQANAPGLVDQVVVRLPKL
jgi:hypothetical protein